MVEVVGNPIEWAVSIILTHSFELSLSGQIMDLISSCKISAAVPGSELRPAALSSIKNSSTDILRVFLP